VEEKVEETPAAKKELGEKNLDDFLRDWDNSSSSSSSCSSAPAAPALLLQRAVKKSKKAVKAAPTGEKIPSTLSLLYEQAPVIMTSQSETVEKPIAIEEVTKAPAVKKSKKAVKAAPTGEKTPSYQAMVKQAVVETKSRTGSSLNTVKKFVIGKFPVDAAKAPARILKAVNELVAAGELVPAAPAGRKGAHSYKIAPPEKGVKKAGVGPSKAAEPKVSKPKTAKKVAKPKSAKADKAAPKKSAKKASATKKPSEKAAAAKKPSKKATAAKKTVKKTSVKKATKKVSSAKATKKASA